MSGWNSLSSLVTEELRQSLEEGKPPSAVDAIRAQWQSGKIDADGALDALQSLPVSTEWLEPSDLEGIQAARPPAGTPQPHLPDHLQDRIQAAWLGRCIGCALGKPLELIGLRGPQQDGIDPWIRIKKYLEGVSPSEWPIHDYIPRNPAADSDPEIGAPMPCESFRDTIHGMETDDDIRYMVVALEVLERHGFDFLPWHVADTWMSLLPYKAVCTAETQAYRNLVGRYEFHFSSDFGKTIPPVDWHWITHHHNPYREWIGAQIRIDVLAYAAAGNPPLAAELAWRDASISHVKNGIYGAMFCAAMIAAAFSSPSPASIIQAGLAEIPAHSRLAAAIRKTITTIEREKFGPSDFEAVFSWLHQHFGHYDPVHTIPNAALCAAAVLLGQGDFEKSVTIAVMGGWDTDCNGATVGSIAGALNGLTGIPGRWSAPLHDTLKSSIAGTHPIPISECARRTFAVIGSATNRVAP